MAKVTWHPRGAGRGDRLPSRRCGHPRAAFGEHGAGIMETQAVFGGGGQVAADGAELAGAGEGGQAAGYLLPQLGPVARPGLERDAGQPAPGCPFLGRGQQRPADPLPLRCAVGDQFRAR